MQELEVEKGKTHNERFSMTDERVLVFAYIRTDKLLTIKVSKD